MPQYLIERINTYCQLIIITCLDYVLLQMNSLANIKSVLIVVIQIVFVAILLHKITYVSNIPFNSVPISPSNWFNSANFIFTKYKLRIERPKTKLLLIIAIKKDNLYIYTSNIHDNVASYVIQKLNSLLYFLFNNIMVMLKVCISFSQRITTPLFYI
ncbi:uncharacterized protein PWA37_002922 [Arxiozyma heterogenica]|uniref:uncharacterized protein n=1 Tax=Arxiozyma heterogenica TaxID=278026 RepID=UPI002F1A1024